MRKLRVDLVARERKRVAEKVRRARVARQNARERKFKSARIALLYAERLLRRISFGLIHFIYTPPPDFTVGGVEAPTAIHHRRVRTMPVMLIIMIIMFFAADVPRPNLAVYRRLYTSRDCLGGGSTDGFDGGGGSGGCGSGAGGSGGGASGIDVDAASGGFMDTLIPVFQYCRYVYNADTERNCSPFVSPFDALPIMERETISDHTW